jgi:hypothetical protein
LLARFLARGHRSPTGVTRVQPCLPAASLTYTLARTTSRCWGAYMAALLSAAVSAAQSSGTENSFCDSFLCPHSCVTLRRT